MKFNLKTIGAELVLGTMILPWVVWVTIMLFSSKTAEAVQESKYDYIVKRLDEIKSDIRAMRQ